MFNQFGHYIGPLINPCKYIDTHELLKTEIYSQTDDPSIPVSMDYPTPSLPPGESEKTLTGQYSSTSLYFDSYYKDSANYAEGTIAWQISPINKGNIISNCIALTMNPFYLQKPNAATTIPDPFYYRKVYVGFPNISVSSAVQTGTANTYHFEFDVTNLNSQAVNLIPSHSPNTFFFTRPITGIFDLSCRFMLPPTFGPVPLYPDKVELTMVYNGLIGYNPIRFAISAPYDTSAIGLVGALTAPGVAIDISNFVSNDPAVNALVNSTAGLFATNILSASTFEIAGINATTVTAISPATPITMYIRKNRIAFELTFTSLDANAPLSNLTRV